MTKHLIAVYGTLKRGMWNHHYLVTSKFVKMAHTGSGYALFVESLPFLVKREDGRGCFVEIFEVSEDVLKDLDSLEGHPTFYKRQFLMKLDDRNVEIYILNNNDFDKDPIENAKESFDP